MLAGCVLRTWEEKEENGPKGAAARTRALAAHDGERNFKRLAGDL